MFVWILQTLITSFLIPMLTSTNVTKLSYPINYGDDTNITAFTMYNKTLISVTCQNLNTSKRNCSLNVETYLYYDLPHARICPFTLEALTDYELQNIIRVFAYENYITVVSEQIDSKAKYVILQRRIFHPFDCRMENPRSFVLKGNHSVIGRLILLPSKKPHEMIHANNETESPQERNISLVEFGSLKLMNVTEIRRGYFVFPTKPTSENSNAGYPFVLISEERIDAPMFFFENMIRALGHAERKNLKPMISTAAGSVSICLQETANSDSLDCSRDDLTTTKNLKFNHRFRDAVIYNLPGQKIAVVTVKENETVVNCYALMLNVFSEDGFLREIKIEEMCHPSNPTYIHVFISEDDFDRLCIYRFKRIKPYEFHTACYSKSCVLAPKDGSLTCDLK
ncbi:hypothetical protein QAD02_000053 [Eretmocerus hayati]|uniref:Uncharacterized protein n=1 Tax=Eretmocerus hayati TaxID=131215 RepID=A0ACC2NEM8_9HYME|nr:hypothetical protein QAD02_000053 [Eretmocerus hayati]